MNIDQFAYIVVLLVITGLSLRVCFLDSIKSLRKDLSWNPVDWALSILSIFLVVAIPVALGFLWFKALSGSYPDLVATLWIGVKATVITFLYGWFQYLPQRRARKEAERVQSRVKRELEAQKALEEEARLVQNARRRQRYAEKNAKNAKEATSHE